MDTIDSLIEEFVEGALRIDCQGITVDEANRIDDLLTQHTEICANDDDFEHSDGSVDFSGYIMYYYQDYQYLGVRCDEDDSYPTICMWCIKDDRKRHISYEDFLLSVDVKNVEIEGFDELFE